MPEEENGAWSADEVRAKVPEKTQTMDVKRAEALGGTSSATDCDNGEQVVVATDDGDALVDAPVHSEVRSEEQKISSHTGANVAAVADGGGDTPLVTMEDPAAEESMPAVDDLVRDPDGVSPSKKEETLPTGGLQEVDTAQTATEEAEPLAEKEDSPESLERKVDDRAELVQEQDEQLAPEVEKTVASGAEENLPVPADQKDEGPNVATPSASGKHCFQTGDTLIGTVHCINLDGVCMSMGDIRVLIPETENSHLSRIGDTVEAMVDYIANDGVIIMKLDLDLVDDPSSSETRRWKRGRSDQWWGHLWYSGQWDQDSSSYGQWDWGEEEWQCYGWTPDKWTSAEEWEEGVLKQFYGEKLIVMLGHIEVEEDYRGKITGMILGHSIDEIKLLVAESARLNTEVQEAYNILNAAGWKPDKSEVVQRKRGKYPRRLYHNAMYDLVRERRIFSEAATGEAVAKVLNKGDEEFWYELWMDTKKILQEVEDMVESMRVQEGRPIEDYLDPSKHKKVHMAPKVSKGYSKLCTYYNRGYCRNGDKCAFEHRKYGEGWPEKGPMGSETGNNAGDDDEDTAGPPTEEGAVDDAQEEREDAAFRAKYNYGQGASKGDCAPGEPKKQLCLYYNDGGCKYGANCRYAHDDNAVLEGTREAGKSWDNASRKAIRDASFTMSVMTSTFMGNVGRRHLVADIPMMP